MSFIMGTSIALTRSGSQYVVSFFITSYQQIIGRIIAFVCILIVQSFYNKNTAYIQRPLVLHKLYKAGGFALWNRKKNAKRAQPITN